MIPSETSSHRSSGKPSASRSRYIAVKCLASVLDFRWIEADVLDFASL
ncbi:MAG: hypothetical protein HT579_00150 [Candidatus Accumulibacter similis]|nr:MAG: hypothetical protein HT579_00150 [Candidatus Accumulibacter similis]